VDHERTTGKPSWVAAASGIYGAELIWRGGGLMSHHARSRYARLTTTPYPTREASTIMGISPSTVLRLCRSGDLPSARIASRIVIRVGDIYDYLERQKLYGATGNELLATVNRLAPLAAAGAPGGRNCPKLAFKLAPPSYIPHLAYPTSKSVHTVA